MKKKNYFYIDVKEKKIKRGKNYIWNTLIVNTEKLKWNPEYRIKIINRFKSIMLERAKIKPKRFVYTGPRKRYFSSKINNLEPKEFTSRAEINIIKRNEEIIKIINEINIKD